MLIQVMVEIRGPLPNGFKTFERAARAGKNLSIARSCEDKTYASCTHAEKKSFD
jgi:hypothetical protein